MGLGYSLCCYVLFMECLESDEGLKQEKRVEKKLVVSVLGLFSIKIYAILRDYSQCNGFLMPLVTLMLQVCKSC